MATEGVILTSAEVADELGVQHDTVRKYVQRGLLHPLKNIGSAYVFLSSEFKRFQKSRRKGPGRPRIHG